MYEQYKPFDTNIYRNGFRSAGRAIRYIHEATSMDELVDVDAGSPANGDVLEFDTISGMWKNVKKKHIGYIYTTGTVTVSLSGASSTLSVDAARAGTLIVNLTANHTASFPSSELAFYCDTTAQDSRVSTVEVASPYSLTLASNSYVEVRGTTTIPANTRAILYWNRVAGNKWQVTPYVILSSFNLPTINANQITYNNSSSGLSATNAQTAIDEVNSRITSSLAPHLKQSSGPSSVGVISTSTVTRDVSLSSSVILDTIDTAAFPPDWLTAADGSSMIVWHSMPSDTTITYDSGTAVLSSFTTIASCDEWQELLATGSYTFKRGKLFFNWIKQSGSWLLTVGYVIATSAILDPATEATQGVVRLASFSEAQAGLSSTSVVTPHNLHPVVEAIANDQIDQKLIKADQSQAELGTSNDVYMTALRTKQAIVYNLPLLTGFANQEVVSHLLGPQGAGIYTSLQPGGVRSIWVEFPEDPITVTTTRIRFTEDTYQSIYRETWNPSSSVWELSTSAGEGVWEDASGVAAAIASSIDTNRPYATQAEMNTGTNNTKVTIPLRVKQAIDYHRPYATQAEMNTGTNNTKISTPLRVKQAIDYHRPHYVVSSTGDYSAGNIVWSNGDTEVWGIATTTSTAATSTISISIPLSVTLRGFSTDVIITPTLNTGERYVISANVDIGSGTNLTVLFSKATTTGNSLVQFRWRAFCRGYL